MLARGKLRRFPVLRLGLALRAVLHSFCCSGQNSLLTPAVSFQPSALSQTLKFGFSITRLPDGPITRFASRPERHAQMLQQRPRLIVRARRRHDGTFMPFSLSTFA